MILADVQRIGRDQTIKGFVARIGILIFSLRKNGKSGGIRKAWDEGQFGAVRVKVGHVLAS